MQKKKKRTRIQTSYDRYCFLKQQVTQNQSCSIINFKFELGLSSIATPGDCLMLKAKKKIYIFVYLSEFADFDVLLFASDLRSELGTNKNWFYGFRCLWVALI